jgi:hypothetical protein
MSVSNLYASVGYGLSEALPVIPPAPIVSQRTPTTADKAPIGQEWVYVPSNAVYILTSIVSNSATWVLLGAAGGSGVFSSVTATTGNITATLGSIVSSAGSLSAATGITSTTGNIVATAGIVEAGTVLRAAGDTTGAASTTSISNVTNTTQSSGALTILSTTATSRTNTGLLKIYIGTVAAYIPYFETIG